MPDAAMNSRNQGGFHMQLRTPFGWLRRFSYNPPMQNWRRLARVFFRIVAPAAIIIAVAWQFYSIFSRPELRNVHYACRFEWLLPAGLLYLMTHTIWASFWVTLLRHQGVNASFATGWRAYFISQYGKYIPGKVWVIIIRIVMLGGTPKNKAIVGVTATYEALTSMGSGAILGAILLPLLNIDLLSFGAQNYVLIAIAAIPLCVGVLHRLIVRITQRQLGSDIEMPNMNILVLVRGLIQTSIGWLLLGLSVWMVMQGIRPETVDFLWDDWIRVTAINCLSYVLGFIVLVAPAGGGVREYVTAVLLAHVLEATMPMADAKGLAALVAVVVRAVWTLAEVVLGVLLYLLIPSAQRHLLVPAVKELVK
jgi:glycosyltransferase 2 family protein